MTALCADVTSCSAMAVKRGHPNTTPKATIARRRSCARDGSGALASEQDQPGEQRGEGLSPDAHEGRVELLHRHASGGQREAEGEHAEEAEKQRHRR